jgi:two-component system, NarL family, response regulator NreC
MSKAEPITLLLADDHSVVRTGFRHLLAKQWDMLVVGEAANGLEAVAMVSELKPNVVVMDVTMPGLNGRMTLA